MPQDPNQKFVINVISRKQIAESIEPYTKSCEKVDPTDDRLTDEFCGEYAMGLYCIETDSSGANEDFIEEAEMSWASEMAAKFDVS